MKWNKFSKFSAYARAESHLVHQTVHGGIVTVCGCLLALTLFGAEVKHHVTPELEQLMTVDSSREAKLRFSFDITFLSLPCQVLSIDLRDAAGDTKSDQDKSTATNGVIHKYRLDKNGKRIGLEEFITPHPHGMFFRRKPQEIDEMNRGVAHHEGCHVQGYLDVKRVAANFHISVHVEDYMLLAQTQIEIQKQLEQQLHDSGHGIGMIEFPNDPSIVNVSHVINSVTFGPIFPGQSNPLSGLKRIVDHDAGTFKYYIKVVPTQYKPARGKAVATNQYSVTEYWTKGLPHDMTLPSVWLMYDLSPINVVVQPKQRSLFHFLVRFCAVVGGCFAVTGLLDKVVHNCITATMGGSHVKRQRLQ